MEILTGCREGSQVYALDGYMYSKNKNKKNTLYLHCTEVVKRNCRARAILINGCYQIKNEHNHTRDDLKISKHRLRTELRYASRACALNIRDIYEKVSSRHQLAAKYVSFQSVRKLMKNAKESTKMRVGDSQSDKSGEIQGHSSGGSSPEDGEDNDDDDDDTHIRDVDQDASGSENDNSSDTDRCETTIKQEYIEPEVVVKEEPDEEMSTGEAVPGFASVFIETSLVQDGEKNNYLPLKTEVEENLEENKDPGENAIEASGFSGYDQGPPSTTGPVISSTSVLSCSSAPTVSVVTTFPSSVTTSTVSTVTGLMSTMVPVIPNQGTSFDSTQQFFFYNSQQASNIVMLPPQQNILSCAPMVVPKFSNEVQKPKKLRAIAPAQPSMNKTPQNSLPFPNATPTHDVTSLPVPIAPHPAQANVPPSIPPLRGTLAPISTKAISSFPIPSAPSSTQAIPSVPVPLVPPPTQEIPSFADPNAPPPIQAIPSFAVPNAPPPMQAIPSFAVQNAPPPIQAIPSFGVPNGPPPIQAIPSFPVRNAPPPTQAIPSPLSSTQTNNSSPIQPAENFSLISSFLEQFYTETANMIKIDLTSVPESLKRGITMKFKELCEAIFYKRVDPSNIIIAFPLS